MSDLVIFGYIFLAFLFFVMTWMGYYVIQECWEEWVETYRREQAFKAWREKRDRMRLIE